MTHLFKLLEALVACRSITPHDDQCQELMLDFLQNLGFRCTRFNNPPVSNFYAEYGQGGALLLFAGHTDVVPTGDGDLWQTDPFVLTEKTGMLYGRGVADMKGSLAAMLVAAQRWVAARPDSGRLGFLITSAEEGDHYRLGTPYVLQKLWEEGIRPEYCIVGEPSSNQRLGDTMKIGRRGSLTGKLKLIGKQGHVAYPQLANNPIHTITPALAELCQMVWDNGNAYFPPTSFQITHVHAGGEATNIIPEHIVVYFNLRYSPEQSAASIQNTITECFLRHHIAPEITWTLSGAPFLTHQGRLLSICQAVIFQHTQQHPELSTSGGTSDGRFIAPYGIEVVELGPVNKTIHQINESVAHADLLGLAELYFAITTAILQDERLKQH